MKDEKAEKDERDERTKGNSSAEDETKPGQDSIIAPYAYAGKGGINALTLSGIKRIGKYAYASCTGLEEIVIDAPECVIERNAFSNCPNLKKVRLCVKELGRGCFSYCRKLEVVSLSDGQPLV